VYDFQVGMTRGIDDHGHSMYKAAFTRFRRNVMGTEEEKVKKELILKEEQLLENNIRNDAKKIAELVDEKCIEIAETGKQSNYRSGSLFGNVEGVLYIDSSSVQLVELSENCKLLLYIAAQVKKNVRMKSSCSSIWKKNDGQWKVVFHQRTKCSEQV
jgi:hypothetical protein